MIRNILTALLCIGTPLSAAAFALTGKPPALATTALLITVMVCILLHMKHQLRISRGLYRRAAVWPQR